MSQGIQHIISYYRNNLYRKLLCSASCVPMTMSSRTGIEAFPSYLGYLQRRYPARNEQSIIQWMSKKTQQNTTLPLKILKEIHLQAHPKIVPLLAHCQLFECYYLDMFILKAP